MQGVVMVTVLVLILVLSVVSAGGLHTVINNAKNIDGFFSMVRTATPSTTEVNVFGASKPYGVLSIASCLAWGLGYFGMPQVLLRFMGIRSEHELGRSRRVAIIWVVISMAAAVFIGSSAAVSRGSITSPTMTRRTSSSTLQRPICRPSSRALPARASWPRPSRPLIPIC